MQRVLFVFFLGSMWYVGGTLPCARFYYEGEEGFFGNSFLRVSYQFLYTYLIVVIHWADRVERWVSAVFSSDSSNQNTKSVSPGMRSAYVNTSDESSDDEVSPKSRK